MRDEAFWHAKHPTVDQMYKGRPLPGTDKRFDIDVRHFIWDRDITLQRIIESNHLRKDKNDDAVLAIQKYVVSRIQYHKDESLGNPEYWLFPEETLNLKRGDCEDGAILIASLILNALPKAHHWRVRVAAGWVREAPTAPQGGHAYCTYCRTTDNEWVPIDWCYFQDSGVPVSGKILIRDRTVYQDVWFSFNHLHAYSHTNFKLEGRVRHGVDDRISIST